MFDEKNEIQKGLVDYSMSQTYLVTEVEILG